MVVNQIIEHWGSLILFFQRAALEDNLPTAKSILNALSNPVYKLYLYFLSYILENITRVNREMQSENPKTPLLLEKITNLYKIILRCFMKRDSYTGNNIFKVLVPDPKNYMNFENLSLGSKVEILLSDPVELSKIDKADLHNFRIRCLDFYIELSKQIKN